MTTYSIAGNRGGQSAIVTPTTSRTYDLAPPVVLNEAPVSIGPAPQSLSDSVASSDYYYYPVSLSMTDSMASSDSLSVNFPLLLSDTISSSDYFAGPPANLSDTVSSSDVYGINFPLSLADTVVSHDVTSVPVPLHDSVTASESLYISSAFALSLADNAGSFDFFDPILNIASIPECGYVPVFPTLPVGYPVKLSPVLDTTIGTTKSLREMRVAQQLYPLWDIELVFEELRDQTQNQIPFPPFSGLYAEYETLVSFWMMQYGQTGIFAFDAPWDDSRTDQYIATGDGATTNFPAVRTWGTGAFATLAPIGMINTIQNVKINGAIQGTGTYSHTRSYINFVSAPANGTTITMSYSYYYLCRFVADEQDFEEFSRNRWAVPSLKMRSVYWQGCQ